MQPHAILSSDALQEGKPVWSAETLTTLLSGRHATLGRQQPMLWLVCWVPLSGAVVCVKASTEGPDCPASTVPMLGPRLPLPREI